jgi:DNA-binding GntR family transcriptional regulator
MVPMCARGGHVAAHPSAKSSTRREAVVTEIRRLVVLGALRPGEKLREVRLAADLNVSRATLREALNLLVQDGLLVQEPYRGLSVARLEPDAVRDLARTRLLMDEIAIRAIVQDGAAHRVQLVRDAWDAFDSFASDADALVQHDAHVAFHRAIWAASENSMLLRLWPVTEAVTTIVLAQDQARRADPHRARGIHSDLVEAITSGDEQRIAASLSRHTLEAAEEFLALPVES